MRNACAISYYEIALRNIVRTMFTKHYRTREKRLHFANEFRLAVINADKL